MAPDRRRCLQWLGAGAVFWGASGPRPSRAQDSLQPRVSLVAPDFETSVFTACRDGGTEAAKDIGTIAFSAEAPKKPGADEQVKLVTALIAQKVDAIALRAVEGAALAPVCRKAMQRGIKVVAFETPLPRDARLLQIEPANVALTGQTCLRLMAKTLRGKGRVALLSSADGADAALAAALKREWVKPAYDGLKLAAVRTAAASGVDGLLAAQALLHDDPDIDGIIALSPAGLAVAAKAVSDAGAKAKVTGLGLPSQMQDFVKSGVSETFAYWNPVDLGYCASMLAGLAATGTLDAASNAEVAVGRLGTLTIAANSTVTLAQPIVFDASNIERYAKMF